MKIRLAASLLCALLVLSGCGVVEETARRVLGNGIPGLTAGADDAGDDSAGETADRSAGETLSIAADENAADAVAESGDEPGAAGFYKVVEPNGTIRFVSNLNDVPPEQRDDAQRLALAPSKSRGEPRRAAPPRREAKQLAAAEASAPPASIAPTGAHEVVIYTTSWCGWCNKTRAWLDGKGVEYVNKDIERDDDAAVEMNELTGGESGVPVVVIDGQVIRGFDQARMRKLLQL